jgi:hypothetical protein
MSRKRPSVPPKSFCRRACLGIDVAFVYPLNQLFASRASLRRESTQFRDTGLCSNLATQQVCTNPAAFANCFKVV